MDLLAILHKLGNRLGIIEMDPASKSPSAPAKIKTRTVTLAELTTHIEVGDLKDLAEMPAELSVPFEDVFKAAGIKVSATDWNVDRLQRFLDSDPVRKLDRVPLQQAALSALAADKVDAKDIVKDAVSRDKALDAFQALIAGKRELRKAAVEKRLVELEKQRRNLEHETAAEEKQWHEWRQKKRQVERDMARVVGYLIDQSVISVDDDPIV